MYAQNQNTNPMGNSSQRKAAILDLLYKDMSILEYHDKSSFERYGKYTGLASVLAVTSMLAPLSLFGMKSLPWNTKMKYFRYSIGVQIS